MDGVSLNAGDPLLGALELKRTGESMSVSVALLKKSLDMERLMAAELARMLQVGTSIDVTA